VEIVDFWNGGPKSRRQCCFKF